MDLPLAVQAQTSTADQVLNQGSNHVKTRKVVIPQCGSSEVQAVAVETRLAEAVTAPAVVVAAAIVAGARAVAEQHGDG